MFARIFDFIAIYKLYRAGNGRRHAARAAWRIAIKGADF
jgi:hypothetical protein